MAARRVVCGMSGGVDSAVSALLLKEKGFNVVGLFMKNWDARDEKGECTVEADREDAEFVCKTVGIPLFEVDFVKHYWNEVFSNFLQGYERGLTPNPDIVCNSHIKFNHFVHHAQTKLQADHIATGHYARTSAGYDLDKVDPKVGVSLLCARDVVKDQTFFLSRVPQWALQKTIFPLGGLLKSEVKERAARAGMERIAKKKESMGICFIGKKKRFSTFMEQYIEPSVGNVVDVETGRVIGQHTGIHHWTVGQRYPKAGNIEKYFICDIDPDTQDIIVAPGTGHPALFSQSFETEDVYWVQGKPDIITSDGSFEATFRFQHRHPVIGCVAVPSGRGGYQVMLDRPLRAITRGQYAVFYKDNVCLGSARIIQNGVSLYDLNIKDRVEFPKEFS